MIDSPPENSGNQTPPDWGEIIGRGVAGTTLPTTVPPEDTSPGNGSKEDKLLDEEAQDMKSNRGLREKYAKKAYDLACGCISIWAVMLATGGTINALQGRPMWSDAVIIAVTTGTTVSVLAAFLGVIRGLFPSKDSQSEKMSKSEETS